MERIVMVPKLEAIKGGGGSIKVGTTGTVGSLITKELESMQCAQQMPTSSSKGKPPMAPTLFPSADVPAHERLQRRSLNEASSSGGNNGFINNIHHRSAAGTTKRTIQNTPKSSHRVPMLGSDGIAMESPTPHRTKQDKRGSNIVEVVDLKCGNHEKMRSSHIASRLKKLSFSKLSETVS